MERPDHGAEAYLDKVYEQDAIREHLALLERAQNAEKLTDNEQARIRELQARLEAAGFKIIFTPSWVRK